MCNLGFVVSKAWSSHEVQVQIPVTHSILFSVWCICNATKNNYYKKNSITKRKTVLLSSVRYVACNSSLLSGSAKSVKFPQITHTAIYWRGNSLLTPANNQTMCWSISSNSICNGNFGGAMTSMFSNSFSIFLNYLLIFLHYILGCI